MSLRALDSACMSDVHFGYPQARQPSSTLVSILDHPELEASPSNPCSPFQTLQQSWGGEGTADAIKLIRTRRGYLQMLLRD